MTAASDAGSNLLLHELIQCADEIDQLSDQRVAQRAREELRFWSAAAVRRGRINSADAQRLTAAGLYIERQGQDAAALDAAAGCFELLFPLVLQRLSDQDRMPLLVDGPRWVRSIAGTQQSSAERPQGLSSFAGVLAEAELRQDLPGNLSVGEWKYIEGSGLLTALTADPPDEATIEWIVDWIIEQSASTTDQGDRFERLMLEFFRTAPVWVDQFEQVWMWKDWPGNEGAADHGVDLVAENPDGTFTAVQAKCYARSTTLNKPEVDSFISASGRDHFTRRVLVSTTFDIGTKAKKEMAGQAVPVQVITLDDLRDSGVNWADWSPERYDSIRRSDPKTPRDHQREAVEATIEGLAQADRGKAIMACGTGKTYTAQLIAEQLGGPGSLVLVLAPSISLISQTITAWYADKTMPMFAVGVCSDSKAGPDSNDISPFDLVVPPTTDPEIIASRIANAPDTHMKVIFSTYQSSPRISEAQHNFGMSEFDLVICDEAHRTTGVGATKPDEVRAFQLVHDDENIAARRRLYMTATPRVYKPSQKKKAQEKDVVLESMDDPVTYGETFYELGFREAVDEGLLCDYKVLILTVEEGAVHEAFQRHSADLGEVALPQAAQMVGCLNALAKRERIRKDGDVRAFADGDTVPLQRAVAFSNTIKASKHFAGGFARVSNEYQYATGVGGGENLAIETNHVDGSQNSQMRKGHLDWLRDQPGQQICRVLSNAKCLTEGIDVPNLDAILFLEPRKSQVDIVQAVGRVMRRPNDPAERERKKYGYIIIPVAVPPKTEPTAVLKEGRFKAVWQVLAALRSHDEQLNRDVNQIRFNKKPANIVIDHIGSDQEIDDNADPDRTPDPTDQEKASHALEQQLTLQFDVEEFQNLCWATMVQKVGDTHYLTRWAESVADIAAALEVRIAGLVNKRGFKGKFEGFVEGLRRNLNEAISESDAIAMLAQHLITEPVFDAVFPGYALTAANPVAQTMQTMVEGLTGNDLETETEALGGFYTSVRHHIDGIEDPTARQEILIGLYEDFFKKAFPKRAEALGIVYTPTEVTDFIIHAANDALRIHFDGASLSDEGVHILDPFSGTGTFIVQMLRSGLIKPHDLARKFTNELHANEIQLLAYYIATVNIESTYHDATGGTGPVQAFPGIVYADTFQLGEDPNDQLLFDVFPRNHERAETQNALDIRVIVGNPPYSAGQTSQNDNNANLDYPRLDDRIARTYRDAGKKQFARQQLYDSYVRAIRWGSDRVLRGDGGVLAFVSNGGYIDSNSFDGFRKTLLHEFDHLYVYNLRGNQRTAGEQSRREGGKVFGSGSRATVAVLLAIKQPGPSTNTPGELHYRDIGDYLDRETKLRILQGHIDSERTLDDVDWRSVTSNPEGDWINQRSHAFAAMKPLNDPASNDSLFAFRSSGLKTNRDAWNWNASEKTLEANAARLVAAYDAELNRFTAAHPLGTGTSQERTALAREFVDLDPTRFSWTYFDFGRVARGKPLATGPADIRPGTYRPFCRRFVNYTKGVNDNEYRTRAIFPDADSTNLAICFPAPGSSAPPFGVLIQDGIFDLGLFGVSATQCVPLLDLGPSPEQPGLFEGEPVAAGISPDALDQFRSVDAKIGHEDIFFFVYGILHSIDYRVAFAADLRKELPRIPDPASAEQFWAFSKAGRELADLHLGYEEVEKWPDLEILFRDGFDRDTEDAFRVHKMKYPRTLANPNPEKKTKVEDKTTIEFNEWITVRNIPARCHDYRLGSRSALDWVVHQWQAKIYKDSQITNDPNDWAVARDEPTYALDLIGRIVTVSIRTLDIIASLPALEFD